jgi:aspartyl-tRNA(Asn)/glutamyl-tRNA(Gln) amidotransferase subunit A
MHTLTVAQIVDGLKAGRFSSVELTQALLQRIEKIDPLLNSVITLCKDRALQQAQAARVYWTACRFCTKTFSARRA